MCEYPKKRRRSLQSSPTRNAFAAQDPAWSIGELSLHTNTNSPTGSHVMIDNDNLSCYSSSSETFPHHHHHMSGYNLSSHDLSNLSPLEINYEQLSPLVDPDSGLISPDIDTFDLGQPFPPQPPPPQPHHHPGMTMGMGSVMPPNHADVTQSSINWLPTAFSEEIDYAALSGVGVPLRSPNNNGAAPASFQDQLGGMDFAAATTAAQHQQQHQQQPPPPQQPHSPPPPPGRRNSSHSPARSTGGSSNSSAESSGNNSGPGTSGRYYTTSFDGARIPFVRGTKRRRSFNVQSPAPDHHTHRPPARSSLFRDTSGVYQFPEICVPIDSLPPVAVTGPAMDLKAYDRIADAFRQVCHGLGTTFVPFKTLAVPGPGHLNYFLQLYYEHFHPILPMLHLPTLRLGEDEWVLGLAAAAIGCRYADSEELLGFTRPMTEFLRRVVVMSVSVFLFSLLFGCLGGFLRLILRASVFRGAVVWVRERVETGADELQTGRAPPPAPDAARRPAGTPAKLHQPAVQRLQPLRRQRFERFLQTCRGGPHVEAAAVVGDAAAIVVGMGEG